MKGVLANFVLLIKGMTLASVATVVLLPIVCAWAGIIWVLMTLGFTPFTSGILVGVIVYAIVRHFYRLTLKANRAD